MPTAAATGRNRVARNVAREGDLRAEPGAQIVCDLADLSEPTAAKISTAARVGIATFRRCRRRQRGSRASKGRRRSTPSGSEPPPRCSARSARPIHRPAGRGTGMTRCCPRPGRRSPGWRSSASRPGSAADSVTPDPWTRTIAATDNAPRITSNVIWRQLGQVRQRHAVRDLAARPRPRRPPVASRTITAIVGIASATIAANEAQGVRPTSRRMPIAARPTASDASWIEAGSVDDVECLRDREPALGGGTGQVRESGRPRC